MPERSRPIHARRWFEHDNPAADGAIVPPPYTSSREHYRLHGSELGHALWENTADRLSRNTTEHNPRRRRRSVSTVSEHDPGDFPCSRDHEQLRQHLAKRRRLDPDSTPVALPPIKYGYYGQVVPGQLKMMVISCDGGELEDPTSPMMYLGPQNILKHDRSVYCSTRKEASIILRHADDTPFSLTTLDILSPPSGFQTRFRRGCAYVSMDLSSLSEHTVRPEEPWPSGALCTPTGAPIDWALVLNRNGEDAADMVGEMHTVTLCDATDIPEEEKTDQRWTEYLAARTRAARRPHVDRARWRSRQLNRTLPYNNDFSFFTQPPVPAAVVDDPHDNAADTIDDTDTADEASVSGSRDIAHAATQTGPCWEHNWHDSQEPAKPAVVAVQFDIKQESQSGITIKFDIAVSGRFILLKLGSYEDCNTVDVQTVLVTGYAGPRFFPAVQMR